MSEEVNQLKWFVSSKAYDVVIAENKKFDKIGESRFTLVYKGKDINVLYHKFDIIDSPKELLKYKISELKESLRILHDAYNKSRCKAFPLCIIEGDNMYPFLVPYNTMYQSSSSNA